MHALHHRVEDSADLQQNRKIGVASLPMILLQNPPRQSSPPLAKSF